MVRIEDVQRKLAASMDPTTGKPLPGYRARVMALQQELRRLETARDSATRNPAG